MQVFHSSQYRAKRAIRRSLYPNSKIIKRRKQDSNKSKQVWIEGQGYDTERHTQYPSSNLRDSHPNDNYHYSAFSPLEKGMPSWGEVPLWGEVVQGPKHNTSLNHQLQYTRIKNRAEKVKARYRLGSNPRYPLGIIKIRVGLVHLVRTNCYYSSISLFIHHIFSVDSVLSRE